LTSKELLPVFGDEISGLKRKRYLVGLLFLEKWKVELLIETKWTVLLINDSMM